jgi:hypothetical protein
MYREEEKFRNAVKITLYFLIMLLGVAFFGENTMIMLLLFYISFIKG